MAQSPQWKEYETAQGLPSGHRLMRVSEANKHRQAIVDGIGQRDICELDGGKINGQEYGGKVEFVLGDEQFSHGIAIEISDDYHGDGSESGKESMNLDYNSSRKASEERSVGSVPSLVDEEIDDLKSKLEAMTRDNAKLKQWNQTLHLDLRRNLIDLGVANGGHQLHTEWYPEVENTPDLPMIGGLVERPNPTLSEHVEIVNDAQGNMKWILSVEDCRCQRDEDVLPTAVVHGETSSFQDRLYQFMEPRMADSLREFAKKHEYDSDAIVQDVMTENSNIASQIDDFQRLQSIIRIFLELKTSNEEQAVRLRNEYRSQIVRQQRDIELLIDLETLKLGAETSSDRHFETTFNHEVHHIVNTDAVSTAFRRQQTQNIQLQHQQSQYVDMTRSQIDDINEALRISNERLEDLELREREYNEEIDKLRAQLVVFEESQQEKKCTLKRRTEEVDRLKVINESLQRQVGLLQMQITDHNGKCQRWQEQIVELRNINVNLREKHETVVRTNTQLMFVQEQRNEFETTIGSCNCQDSGRESEIDELTEEVEKLKEINASLTVEIEGYKAEHKTLNVLIVSLKKRNNRLQQLRLELESENKRSFNVLHQQNITLLSTISEINEEKAKLERQIESHRVTINERRSEEHLQITTLNTQVLELKQQCEETEVLKQLIESYKVQIERLQGGGGRWKIEKNKLLSTIAELRESTLKLKIELKNLEGTNALLDVFRDEITELEQENQRLRVCKVNQTSCEHWDIQTVHQWVLTLGNGRFEAYEDDLSTLLTEQNTTGSALQNISEEKLSFMEEEDRAALLVFVSQLISNGQSEIQELKITIEGLQSEKESYKTENQQLKREIRNQILENKRKQSQLGFIRQQNLTLQKSIRDISVTNLGNGAFINNGSSINDGALQDAVSVLKKRNKTLKTRIDALEHKSGVSQIEPKREKEESPMEEALRLQREVEERQQREHREVEERQQREREHEEFSKRLKKNGANVGTNKGSVDISLIWDNSDSNKNDLDLWVQCPSGDWIGYNQKKSQCGGELDVDKRQDVAEPVEHIVWRENAPKGTYKVQVHNYNWSHQGPKPFRVRIVKDNGQAEVIQMEMPAPTGDAKSTALNPKDGGFVEVKTFTI